MIERRAEFIHELNDICETIVKSEKLNDTQQKMKESFLEQASGSPENIACIENLEYGIAMKCLSYNGKKRKFYGLKIKDTDVLVSDIAYFLERDEVIHIIKKAHPELSVQQIESAQRAITLILTGFECIELGKYYENKEK